MIVEVDRHGNDGGRVSFGFYFEDRTSKIC